ncbi:hypothetical protein IF650_05355 [Cellulosimicrobium terreum]|nr:hypothetical protein [Cellulosimicrobium terreum]
MTTTLEPPCTLHRVEVLGASSGTAPATWGQTAIRRALAALAPLDHQFNVVWGGAVPSPVPVDDALGVLRDLLLLHDALRTVLRDDDVVGGTGYVQVLHGDGGIDVTERAVERPDDAAEAVQHLRDALWGRPFDHAHEWPVRAGLVTVDGLVHHVVVVVSHTALDGWGLPVLDASLTALAGGTDLATVRARQRARTPLEEARWQVSPEGERHDAGARERALRTMRAAPVEVFPLPGIGPVGAPRYRQAVLRSRRLATAADAAAARLGTTASTVLLAASSLALARAGGRDDCVLQVMVSNRFLPGLARVVAPIAMEGLLHVDGLRSTAFDDVVPRVWGACMTAYRSAYYDKDRLVRDAAADPDAVFDDSCWFNDRRGTGPDPHLHADPTPRRRLAWGDAPENQGGITLAFHHVDAPPRADGRPGGVDLVLTVDTRRIDEATAETVLRDTERLVLDARAHARRASSG